MHTHRYSSASKVHCPLREQAFSHPAEKWLYAFKMRNIIQGVPPREIFATYGGYNVSRSSPENIRKFHFCIVRVPNTSRRRIFVRNEFRSSLESSGIFLRHTIREDRNRDRRRLANLQSTIVDILFKKMTIDTLRAVASGPIVVAHTFPSHRIVRSVLGASGKTFVDLVVDVRTRFSFPPHFAIAVSDHADPVTRTTRFGAVG
jgi:hypothetical protein